MKKGIILLGLLLPLKANAGITLSDDSVLSQTAYLQYERTFLDGSKTKLLLRKTESGESAWMLSIIEGEEAGELFICPSFDAAWHTFLKGAEIISVDEVTPSQDVDMTF